MTQLSYASVPSPMNQSVSDSISLTIALHPKLTENSYHFIQLNYFHKTMFRPILSQSRKTLTTLNLKSNYCSKPRTFSGNFEIEVMISLL